MPARKKQSSEALQFAQSDHFFITLYAVGRGPHFEEQPALKRVVSRCWRETLEDFPDIVTTSLFIKPWSLQALIRIPHLRRKKHIENQVAEDQAPYHADSLYSVEKAISAFVKESECRWQIFAKRKKILYPPVVWQDEQHIHRLYDLTEYRVFFNFFRREKK